jgi:hypothetical protein
VVCRSDATTPEGNSKTLEVLTYDSNSGAYTHYNIGSLRESSLFSTGKLEGKTWRWHAEPGTKGQKQVYDYWWTETSANSYTFNVAVSIDNGPPKTAIQGKATRMK